MSDPKFEAAAISSQIDIQAWPVIPRSIQSTRLR